MNRVKIEVRPDPSQVEKDLLYSSLAKFKEFGIFGYGDSKSIVAGLLVLTCKNKRYYRAWAVA
jgi:hypothetical protein